MSKRRDRVCGADVHKDLIVATIVSDDESPIQSEFGTTKSELERFKEWLVANKCKQVAFEATGVYWIPVYDAISTSIDTIVANPYQIKTIPNDKSDSKDSKRIATLCLNNQIKRSRVFVDEDRDLRRLTRARSGYVKTRTQFRNRIHKYLASNGIKLKPAIDDIFGKSGRHILNGLVDGKSTDEILGGIPSKRIMKKRDLIKAALGDGLDGIGRMLVGNALDVLDNLESKIEETSHEILDRVHKRSKDLAIVMSVPGIGFVSGSIILAEIGDYHDFQTPEQLAKWCGLTPGENESAGKKKRCGITKRGSKYLRNVLIEAAQTISNMGRSKLFEFFQRLSAKKERNVAITALARKLICLIYHLLINQELYQEDGGRSRRRRSRPAKSENESSPSEVDRLGDKIAAIVDAFYHLKPRSRKNALMRELGALNMSDFGPGRPSDGGG
jgi:transposase